MAQAIDERITAEGRAEETVAELLARLEGRLRSILWRYRVPERDAEDVLQETLLLFVQKRSTIRRPEAWIITTLRNQAIMYQRRRRCRGQYVLEPGHDLPLDLCVSIPGGQGRVEARLAIEGGLEVLPEREREVLRLRQLEGFSTREVAPRIGYRPASVRKVLARACRALRQAIELPAS